jgi:hypothetical protein
MLMIAHHAGGVEPAFLPGDFRMTRRSLLGWSAVMVSVFAVAVVFAGDAPMVKCPVMGEPANLALSTATDDGPVFFCCKGCIKKFEADPAKYASAVADQRKALADRAKVQVKCPVEGNPADDKITAEVGGQKLSFCSKECIEKYKTDAAEFKKGLANAYTYQTKCPVMDETVNGKSFTTLATGETIYYCCKGCDKKLQADPAKYAPKLAEQGVVINPDKLKPSKGG